MNSEYQTPYLDPRIYANQTPHNAKMGFLIKTFTICLQNVLLKFEKNKIKYHQTALNLEMGSSYW